MDLNTEYKETGNKVPLPLDELLNYAQEKLHEYDRMVEATQSKPSNSPYNDPIIYITKEGKLVQIPKYIQQQAIELWNNTKKKLTNFMNQPEIEYSEDLPVSKKFEEEEEEKKGNNTWKYVLCVIVTILILISAYVMMKEKSLKVEINM